MIFPASRGAASRFRPPSLPVSFSFSRVLFLVDFAISITPYIFHSVSIPKDFPRRQNEWTRHYVCSSPYVTEREMRRLLECAYADMKKVFTDICIQIFVNAKDCTPNANNQIQMDLLTSFHLVFWQNHFYQMNYEKENDFPQPNECLFQKRTPRWRTANRLSFVKTPQKGRLSSFCQYHAIQCLTSASSCWFRNANFPLCDFSLLATCRQAFCAGVECYQQLTSTISVFDDTRCCFVPHADVQVARGGGGGYKKLFNPFRASLPAC